ncbi:MAG: ATPase [Rhodobacteraceae bacterium]|nr:ATPase [Paracoccaceae bacterium]MCY4195722.1 ATPase [Paracoccaceae bacterium]
MPEWRPRKDWSHLSLSKNTHGLTLCRDDAAVRTPANNPLTVPTRELARELFREWESCTHIIQFEEMHFTRRAFRAIDEIATSRAELLACLSRYAAHELLCHRATSPPELVDIQDRSWNPILDWAATQLNAPMTIGTGVMPIAQSPDSLANLINLTAEFSDFTLSALQELIQLTGSCLLGLAVVTDHLTPERAWDLSHLDEEWQAQQWGRDSEADAAAKCVWEEFKICAEFESLSRVRCQR